MRLVYSDTGVPVQKGDKHNLARNGEAVEMWTVQGIQEPHHSGSTGRVYVVNDKHGCTAEYFPGVIDAEWIEREDRS